MPQQVINKTEVFIYNPDLVLNHFALTWVTSTGFGDCSQVLARSPPLPVTHLHWAPLTAAHRFTEVQQLQLKLDTEGNLQLTSQNYFWKPGWRKNTAFLEKKKEKSFPYKFLPQRAEEQEPKLSWQCRLYPPSVGQVWLVLIVCSWEAQGLARADGRITSTWAGATPPLP